MDLMGSARYWNQDVDVSLRLTGTLTVDLRELGLQFQRSRRVAIARSGDVEWVDPVVGARIRHQIAPGKEFRLLGDVGGFIRCDDVVTGPRGGQHGHVQACPPLRHSC